MSKEALEDVEDTDLFVLLTERAGDRGGVSYCEPAQAWEVDDRKLSRDAEDMRETMVVRTRAGDY